MVPSVDQHDAERIVRDVAQINLMGRVLPAGKIRFAVDLCQLFRFAQNGHDITGRLAKPCCLVGL